MWTKADIIANNAKGRLIDTIKEMVNAHGKRDDECIYYTDFETTIKVEVLDPYVDEYITEQRVVDEVVYNESNGDNYCVAYAESGERLYEYDLEDLDIYALVAISNAIEKNINKENE